jgi:hypothetical protein
MEDKSIPEITPDGLTPQEFIEAFCKRYKEHTVVNRIWLWYSLAVESGKISEKDQPEFALFIDQLKNLMAAVYNFHQANKASETESGGTQ